MTAVAPNPDPSTADVAVDGAGPDAGTDRDADLAEPRLRPVALWLTSIIYGGVLLAAIVDWTNGQPPQSPFEDALGPLQLPVFIASVALGWSAAVLSGGRGPGLLPLGDDSRPGWSLAVEFVAVTIGVMTADANYSILLLSAPLLAIRSRPDLGHRRPLTLLIVLIGLIRVNTVQGPFSGLAMELMVGLVVGLVVTMFLGDAVRAQWAARRQAESLADELTASRRAALALAASQERNRLARELHDSVGHNLLAASIQLRKAEAYHGRDDERSAEAVGFALVSVTEALSDIRFSVDNLRESGSTFDLQSSLDGLGARISASGPRIVVTGRAAPELSPVEALALYRVAQEAVTNAVRHSRATRIEIRVDDRTLTVSDDGVGFVEPEAEAGHESQGQFGLLGMRERMSRVGGRADIDSEPGRGTTVTATLGEGR